jgi:hypothetical protein
MPSPLRRFLKALAEKIARPYHCEIIAMSRVSLETLLVCI